MQFDMIEHNHLDDRLTTGTTIIALEFNGGVMLGADTRTSAGTYVANRFADKLTRITNSIYCCRAGIASDTQAIADIVAYHMDFYKNETGKEPTVKFAAEVFRDICYKYSRQLHVAIIVAGWDLENKGQVYTVTRDGAYLRQKCAFLGSGSLSLCSYIDANFKENMSPQESEDFLKNAIALSISRDIGSGGVIRLGIIDNKGHFEAKLFKKEEIPKFANVSRMIRKH